MIKKTFASDNYAGVHPKIMEALAHANHGHAAAYGADVYTASATQKLKALFGEDIEVFFVYNGTGANVLGLQALTQSYHAILCSELAHINVDESTAPEKFLGCKLIPVPQHHGKICPEQIESRIQRLGDQHHPQARVISISQTTEYATVYTVEEIQALQALARKHGLYLHMDGARIANAVTRLKTDIRTFTKNAGIDVLSFGGTKNGMMFGEAVIFFNPGLATSFPYIRKQSMQLQSKMRFISAQFDALLADDLWLRNAEHANNMAKMLAQELESIPGVTITQPVDANGVFAILPGVVIPALQSEYFFYVWNEKLNEVRLMCSFDTTPEDVQGFATVLRRLMDAGNSEERRLSL